ncbi:9181_t:CDS:2 [Cetraspora pellucida]|uniref:9181_t:CDS:1 n=1 Tax=Cetraspora pellucida TaxID=1433469 RepID=A0ACA9JXS2_9GLOM|nr:9181_t:CDS:2 [Cetraspora pellucida]
MPGSFPGQEIFSKFKILPAHQFHLTKEAKRKDDPLIFKELVKEINDNSKELIFIPVNQTNYHWSLLVFEVKTKCFYHWDTLGGANDKKEVRQNNGWECGVAVIAIIKRIREKYNDSMKNIELGGFGFKQEREKLRKAYLQENN